MEIEKLYQGLRTQIIRGVKKEKDAAGHLMRHPEEAAHETVL